jgi:hypothetical protein
MIVTLTGPEVSFASAVGLARQTEAIIQGKKDAHGFRGDPWGVHIEGALAEYATAKALNCFWPASVNTWKEPDLTLCGVGIQVRLRSHDHYDLLVREPDPEQDVYVLTLGTAPTFRVAGWLFGQDAKQARYRQDYAGRVPAYFVPQVDLRPLASIRKALSEYRRLKTA